jgi:hypothetical protein
MGHLYQSLSSRAHDPFLDLNPVTALPLLHRSTRRLHHICNIPRATINAMASARKPVIVRKFSRDWSAGYADTTQTSSSTECEILDVTGKVLRIPWSDVKWVCYVRDLPQGEASNPERLIQKRFATRPRTAGLWLRMSLIDGEELEGLAANDRSLVDGSGLLITPPDTRSNTQRVYVPRSAIQTLEVVSLIGAGGRKQISATAQRQPELFPPDQEIALS